MLVITLISPLFLLTILASDSDTDTDTDNKAALPLQLEHTLTALEEGTIGEIEGKKQLRNILDEADKELHLSILHSPVLCCRVYKQVRLRADCVFIFSPFIMLLVASLTLLITSPFGNTDEMSSLGGWCGLAAVLVPVVYHLGRVIGCAGGKWFWWCPVEVVEDPVEEEERGLTRVERVDYATTGTTREYI